MRFHAGGPIGCSGLCLFGLRYGVAPLVRTHSPRAERQSFKILSVAYRADPICEFRLECRRLISVTG